jgi:hypothetical protein
VLLLGIITTLSVSAVLVLACTIARIIGCQIDDVFVVVHAQINVHVVVLILLAQFDWRDVETSGPPVVQAITCKSWRPMRCHVLSSWVQP